jgi:enterochelin esterase-like enzyme
MDRAGVRRLHWPVLTAAVTGAVLFTAVHFGVFTHGLPSTTSYARGFSPHGLEHGHWTKVLSSLLLTRDSFMAASMCLSLVILAGLYEMMAGTFRAVIVAAASVVAGPVGASALAALGSFLGWDVATRALSTIDYGASTICAGLGGALVALLGRRWLTVAAFAFVLSGLALHHQIADWQHLVCMPLGFVLGRSLGRPTTDRSNTRKLAGVALSASAVGVIAFDCAALASPATGAQIILAATSGLTPTTSGWTTQSGPSDPVRVVDSTYPSRALGRNQRVVVVLPAGYGDPGNHTLYPVVELLHGSPGSPDDWLANTQLLQYMSSGAVRAFIAVIPDGHGPVVSDGDFADTSHQLLGTAMSRDLQTWSAAHYRTNGTWTVAGLSSGGYGAAYLGSRGGYAAACPMSGYFTASPPALAGESAAVLYADSPLNFVSKDGPRTMIVYGSSDPEAVSEARRYVAAMSSVGQEHQVVVLPGSHEWAVWDAGLARCLPFLLANGPMHRELATPRLATRSNMPNNSKESTTNAAIDRTGSGH